MLIIMILLVIVSSVCLSIVVSMSKNSVRTERDLDIARTAIGVGIGAGAALYLIASFNLGYSGDADVWDYGKMTMEGYLNILSEVVGVLCVAENIVAAVFLVVKELKTTCDSRNRESRFVVQAKSDTAANVSEQMHSPQMPQGKIPAWKQVEMENQSK